MSFLEKMTDPTAPMHWRGDMQADYLYPNGDAGDRFFQNLKVKDTFLACRCPKCGKRYVPPRLYCEDCFVEIPPENWFEVKPQGTIRLFTSAVLDAHWETLETPKVMAIIDIDGTDGAMLGVLDVDPSEKDLAGKKVRAVLRPKAKREGTLKDIINYVLL